ncbi:hypothetical protein FHQ18_04210 [Deferribacter autotrophicus]|uniref:Uncharacterized protein n=1 Tax=Deferribacter autotrophicus TaxID=500465 RepID=A0A5A8F476_9BACT|nr:hypothetical protein [Deferribacter autotrophicus]KAA0258371.1 hypothetical protein FHQ18_04210 [Deferribacter autotrophicus]
MNINELVRIHDKNQFEIKLGYLINNKKKNTEYNINIYFFIPKNLGINKYTYTNHHFFEDFYSYVRLITPKDTLKSLISRLEKLHIFLKEQKLVIDKHFDHINYELKMTICSYRAYLRDFSKILNKAECKKESIIELLKDVSTFREVIKQISLFYQYAKNERLIDLFKFTDEYSSLLTDVYLFRILKLLLPENKVEITSKIKDFLKKESQYRAEKGMSVVTSNDANNEELIYKYSVYKKFFYNILFLSQKRKEDATELRHFAYAIAAGIAMIFATSIAFISQKKYGNLTMSFFVALVVSYMFKDRIKDFFKQMFDNRFIFKKVYDFRNKIYDLERFRLFGFYKERVRFVSENDVPKRILETRLKKTDSNLTTWYLGENILKYEKKIKLYNDKITNSFKDKIEGLNDIVRFNINKFTKKMDDPTLILYSISEDSLKKIEASKVYHINLVIEFQSEDKKHLYKVRLILTKEGIKRIEIPEYDLTIKNEHII